MRNTRKVTCQLLELVDAGVLNPVHVLEAALNYMSESDVADMAHANELTMYTSEWEQIQEQDDE
jgi:hypothetical protein